MRFMSIVGRLAFAAFLISLAVGLAASFGTRFHVWDFRLGFTVLLGMLAFGLLAFLLGLVWAIAALFMNAAPAARYGVAGFVGSIVLLALPVYEIVQIEVLHAIPPIHDISTDTEHPPQFVALLHLRPKGTSTAGYDGPLQVKADDGTLTTVTALQKKYYTEIRPVENLESPAKLYNRALNAANAMGWTIVSAVREPNGGRIEATDTTFFFGFTDDIVIRVEPSGMGARLDIRSKSRVGMSDLGKNAARIRAYVKTLASS